MSRRILVVHKRDFKLFYDASTQDLTDRAFISLLRYNVESGYIREPVESNYVPADFKMHYETTDEEFAALPVAMRKAMSGDRARAKQYARDKEERLINERLDWDKIQEILACKTFKEAAEFRSPNGKRVSAEALSYVPGEDREFLKVEDTGMDNPGVIADIIVASNKHADLIYDASTPELADRSFCALLRWNWEYGSYIKPEAKMYIPKKYQMYKNMTEEDFLRLPAPIREAKQDEFNKARSWIDRETFSYEADVKHWEHIKRIANAPTIDDAVKIRTPNGKRTIAEVILRHRQMTGYEYESWEIESVIDTSGD